MTDVDAVPTEPTETPQPGSTPGPVLCVFAHPDDAEIAAGGTMARWCTEGRAVHLLVLTNGDRGSSDPAQDRAELARTRLEETRSAGKYLGLAGTTIFDVPDGELENTPEIRARVARVVREIRPGIVLSCDPTVWFFGNQYFNHSDHRTAGAIMLDAVFPGAGNPLYFADQIAEGLEAWNVPEIWLGWTLEPNHHQDVSGHIEAKVAALALHASQVQGNMLGFFEEWLPREAAEAGAKIGVAHAESFRVLNLG
jgi:LmbE family N-acetylglucosaminyl deacetylase